MTQATIAVEDVCADAVRIAVAGEIDLSNATTVERQVLDAITNQLTEVTLDLNALTYIDSAGLRIVFTLASRLDTLQIDLDLRVPTNSPIRRMIELSGVAAAIPVRPLRQ
jgi:anti-anti-sigma factor